MGQTSVKVGLKLQSRARNVTGKLSTKLASVSILKALTYDQFLHELELLNQMYIARLCKCLVWYCYNTRLGKFIFLLWENLIPLNLFYPLV